MATIAVFGASTIGSTSAAYADGVRLGRRLAEAGHTVATGGYAGTMEAVARGAREAGGRTIGVTVPAVFPERVSANEYITDLRPAPTLLNRIGELIEGTDAVIVLDGSIGTFTELMAAWNLAYVARFSDASPKPVITVGTQWRRLVERLANELKTDQALVTCVSTISDALEELERQLQA